MIVSSGSFLKGLKVNGYSGALIAAVAIAVINYAFIWLMGLTGLM